MFSKKRITAVDAALVVLIAIMFLLSACAPTSRAGQAAAQETAVPEPAKSIVVTGAGEAYGQPDEAQLNVGVETFAADVSEATSENEATIQAILESLKEAGVAPDDIQTSNYNLWAEQRYGDNGPEGIAGYRVSNQVNVTIRDIDQVGDVIAAAIDSGANNIYGVTFRVADPAALEAEAREAAIDDARTTAESLAALNGLALGEVLEISEMQAQYPMPQFGMGGGGDAMAATASISPGQLSYSVQVQMKFVVE